MTINVNTNLFKVNSYKDGTVNVVKVLDIGNIESYEFFVDKEVAYEIQGRYGERLIFNGFTYKSKSTGKYSVALSTIKSEDGGLIYEYRR